VTHAHRGRAPRAPAAAVGGTLAYGRARPTSAAVAGPLGPVADPEGRIAGPLGPIASPLGPIAGQLGLGPGLRGGGGGKSMAAVPARSQRRFLPKTIGA